MRIRRIGENADADTADATHGQAPAGFDVPEELRPFYDLAPGPDPQQLLLARAGVEGAIPKQIELRPPGTGPGPRDEYRRLQPVDIDEWVHATKLQQAEQAHRGDITRQAILDSYLRCDLCGESKMGGQLSAIDAGGRELRLCAGDCDRIVRDEIQRRHWRTKLDSLLGG